VSANDQIHATLFQSAKVGVSYLQQDRVVDKNDTTNHFLRK
jgi:hypothetical protein